jgi:hypothetical protein
MAADLTAALDIEGAHGYASGGGGVPLTSALGFGLDIEGAVTPGGGGGGSGPPPRPSSGFLYPRGDY